MRKPILILMSRWPGPKRCKTRLAKEIGFYQAASIQQKLTNHAIAVALKVKEEGLTEVKLAIDGIGQNKIKTWGKSCGIEETCSQGIGSLGLKMKRQIIKAQRRKAYINTQSARHTILIGTDVPNLCETDIRSAINLLDSNELVIGPAEDGGYWLIGFSKNILCYDISWPFIGIQWGTESVLKETIKRAKSKGIKYKLINLKNDIDIKKDLISWQG